ncbi:hypothetical protein [Microbispora sp. H10949]|uniref:hypothetical protein n=1 Tax=Microbispora sp. H10949 TaxID=2729111 RepID=UPI0016036AF7|nr:hypothetical protein [Microbispora sp. H10949]
MEAVSGRPTTSVVVNARVQELLESWRPWHRRLWDVGTVLALREAVEAADWVGSHVLSQGSLAWYARESLLRRLKTDSALGDGQIRRHIHSTCLRPIRPGARSQRNMALLSDLVADGYLRRWRDVLTSGPVHVERSARCIASHLLDEGFHQDFLRQEIKSRLGAAAGSVDLIDLLLELESRGDREYEGLIVIQDRVPAPQVASKSPHWLSREEVSHRLGTAYPHIEHVRASGGLLFRVRARDHVSAVQQVTELFDRVRNRVRYRRGQTALDVYPKVFLTGLADPQDFRRGDPAVTVLSLERVGVLYDLPDSGAHGLRIDDALELAAPLTESSPSTAVAGAWAAIESLLFCDTDEADREEGRAVAADRAAALVTAGWPRAELTALSYDPRIREADPRLRRDLDAIGGNNRERVRRMVRWLAADPVVHVDDPVTTAALGRMRELAAAPSVTLGRVERYLRGCFRRLYRQRNIVLHGGSTRSIALPSTVRTAGPLVGAALDRLAHGHAVSGVAPLDMAGRAELALRVVEDADGWGLHELLGA